MKVKTIQQHVKNECANHDNNFNGYQNYCLTEECPDNKCIYFYDNSDDYYNIRCKYFEECVLPLDKELEIRYWSNLKNELSDKEVRSLENAINKTKKSTVKCGKCGEDFQKKGKQRLCPKCQLTNRKTAQKKFQKNKNKLV